MSDKLKTAFERQTRVVELRPGMGQGTAVTRVTVRRGTTCDITEGNLRLTADMNEKWGGDGEGPTPGTYGRGALGSCFAITYMSWAARMDIPVDALSVEIQADYDTRGACGIGDVRPGYTEVRYVVSVDSPASEEEIKRWLDTADKHCAYLDIFANPQKIRRVLKINQNEE